MQVILGRRLYYQLNTGIIVYDTGERVGENIVDSTIEEDFMYALELRNKDIEQIGILQLEAGQYSDEFSEAVSYRVNPETKQLEFGYELNPMQNEFQKPYKNQISDLESRTKATEDMILALLEGGM